MLKYKRNVGDKTMAAKVVKASLWMWMLLSASVYALPPIAVDDLETDDEDKSISFNVTGNDTHTFNLVISSNTALAPLGGVFSIDANGNVDFDAPEHFSGLVTFDYTVLEEEPGCLGPMPPANCYASATARMFLFPKADLPNLAAVNVVGDEDTDIPLDITIVEQDVDGSQTVTVTIDGLPAGATLTEGALQPDGSYDLTLAQASSVAYRHTLDQSGNVTLSVEATVADEAIDHVGTTWTDTDSINRSFDIRIDAVNDDPVFVGPIPSIDTDEDVDASVDLAGVVTDVDDAVLGYIVTSVNNAAVNGAFLVGSTLNIDVLADQFDNGTVSVEVTDGKGGPSIAFDVPVNIAAVNDDPYVAGAVANVIALEDADPITVDFVNVFADKDIPTGDSLSLSAAFGGGAPLFESISTNGTDLELEFAADQNGVATVIVTATDLAGATVDYALSVQVNAVNDAPEVTGGLPNVAMAEDDPPTPFAVDGAFTDADVATNGDVLTYEVSGTTQPTYFDSLTVVGDNLVVDLSSNANGVADISIVARDSSGAVSAAVTFTLTINSVNDLPTANDDAAVFTEDGGTLAIAVLDNDDIPDAPGTISAVTQPTTYQYLDINGDTLTVPIGAVVIDGDNVLFTPGSNFWGTAEFTYTLRDPQGEESTATVTVTVAEANDPPEARQFFGFTTFQNTDLVIGVGNGLRLGIYDIDNSKLDGAGNPIVQQTITAVFESDPPPAEGFLFDIDPDGSFTFRPAEDFLGVTGFEFTVIDNGAPGFLKSLIGNVEIEVIEPLPAPDDPSPGEVSVLFNLSNTPLEQSSTVSPNVLVTMDDSGSMDWHITINSTDDNARFVINNSGIATSNVRERVYTYLWDLPVNAYGDTSGNGRIVPSMESLPAGNDYNVWQARSSAFNRIYYNPEVTYLPWSGVDNSGNDFANADPSAVRLDPMTGASNILNILNPMSYLSSSVPRWQVNGGSADINVNNYYIPRYYQPDGTLVEIRVGNSYNGGDERDDCAGTGITNLCTYDEEIQNFANWFQYYRSREIVAKAAIGSVVADLQDIRVGYETINRRSDEPIADLNEYYWEGEKKELLDTIYNVNSSGGTPLRRALNDAGTILGCNHLTKPCPALPVPEGICQQNFTLLFSDGYWNGVSPLVGNQDTDGAGPFDGGKYADNFSNYLADVAMSYYENDLFPAVEDAVPVTNADLAGAPVGTFAGPTMHQHMKTYTIAFGVNGALDIPTVVSTAPGGAIAWPDVNSTATAKIDDMLHAAVNGRGRFLNAGDPQELQNSIETAFLEFTQAASSTSAAAFNSTSLREDTLLYRGFYDLRNRTGELTATEVDETTGALAPAPTWTAAELLDASHPSGVAAANRIITSYDAIAKDGIAFRYGEFNANQTATLSMNQTDYIRGERAFEEPNGSLRQRLANKGLLGDIVNSSPVYVGKPRAFNRDQEPYPASPGNFFSDFVADVEDRTPIVYVGANDGMLHGFNAETGIEEFAYVPNMIIDNSLDFGNRLDSFTSSFYLHDYYVDLTPRLNDAFMRPSAVSAKEWLTVIVGGLGAGGKGYYALNVTDPDVQFVTEGSAAQSVLWEFTDADDTYPLLPDGSPLGGAVGAISDPNGNPVKDLGYSLSSPVVTMSNLVSGGEQEWVAIFGNGPNSTAGIATLFVLKMDGGHNGWTYGSDFVKLPTTAGVPLPGQQLEGYPNGLGSPAAVDIDLNGTVDLVYAGDRLGNLWRFDMRDPNQNNWTTVKVFQATYDNGAIDVIQPILSAPLVTKHPQKRGFLITFGTGSFIADGDGESTDIQSIYTIWDNYEVAAPPTALPNSKSLRLVEQVITNVVDDSNNPALTRRIFQNSQNVNYTEEAPGVPGVLGWYIDLDMQRAVNTLSGAVNPDASGEAPPSPQFPGERAIRRLLFRDGNIFTTTVIPASDETSCFGARPGSILIFNGLTGGDPVAPLIDFNLDGVVDENDLVDINGDKFSGGILFGYEDLDGALVDLSTLGGSGDTDFLFVSGGKDTKAYKTADIVDEKTGRQSWTQLRE
jgi:type IV pilus assembly protein PilY1